MEEYLIKRPAKKIYPKKLIEELRQKAIDKLKSKLLPEDDILKIILIGSSVKESFGEYDIPGFRGSLFSDFDFIIFINEKYQISKWLDKEPDGKPFRNEKLNLAYRNRKFVEDKYDIEVFFIRQNTLKDLLIQQECELAGIPITNDSKHPFIEIYKKIE